MVKSVNKEGPNTLMQLMVAHMVIDVAGVKIMPRQQLLIVLECLDLLHERT